MQEKINGRSPYLQALKTRQGSLFPKINKPGRFNNPQSLQNGALKQVQQRKQMGRNQQIAKQTLKVELDHERIINSKQYRDLEVETTKMQHKFRIQMEQIQKKKSRIADKIKGQNSQIYKSKYGIWELRNEILNLEAQIAEEQNQFGRMLYEMGYVQVQAQQNGQIDEQEDEAHQGQYQAIYE